MPIQSTSEGKISLAKGIIFTKIGLANGYIFKLWAATPNPKFSREPPPPVKDSSQSHTKILQNSRFQIYPGEDEVSSCKTRRRVWCLATKGKVTDYRSNASKVVSCEISLKSAKPTARWSRRFGRPAKPAILRIMGVNQTQILSLPSLLFSELAPIKHALNVSSLFEAPPSASATDYERSRKLTGVLLRKNLVHLLQTSFCFQEKSWAMMHRVCSLEIKVVTSILPILP